MRRRLFAGVGAALAVLLASAGTALAEPPAATNPNVVELEIVECGEFTGTVTIVVPESEGGGGNITGFAEGQVGILISLVPASERFPHELIDCAVEFEGQVVSLPIFVPKP